MFIAIDVETANPDLASICQIGVVIFHDYKIVKEWETLINPEDCFNPVNVSIHGIDEDTVQNAPKFPQIYKSFADIITGHILVCHTHFDRIALEKVLGKYQLPHLECHW